MANQTVTTVVNNDSASVLGLLDGETYTINGGALTFNSDSRWSQQAAVIGAMSISATLGGSILLDGRDVWQIPFTTPSGNVPALTTLGSNTVTGGSSLATGEFLGFWATGAIVPQASGGAIVAGFMKLRSKTGNFTPGETITLWSGATIVATNAGRRSWIHVVGRTATTITVPRLGAFSIRGDWYELGTTNGADDQTFQFPVSDACPAIQIETAEGSGVYEWWLNAGARWGSATIFIPQDARGKYFGMVNTTGVITIARRASNACGLKPPTGCRVRIPNVILSSALAASYATNDLTAALADRYDFTTTSSGAIDIEHACMNWYLSCTSAFSVRVKDTAILQALVVSNTASATTFENVGIGLNSTTAMTVLTFSNLFTSLVMTDVRAARYQFNASNETLGSIVDCANIVFTRVQAEGFGSTTAVTRGNASANALLFTRCFGVTLIDCATIAGRLVLTSSVGALIKNHQYADQINGNTTTTNPITAITLDTATANVLIEGFSNFAGIANQHPYTGMIICATGVSGVRIKDIGTPLAPYNCGSANATGLFLSATVSLNIEVQRVYLINTRTTPFSLANTVQNVVIDNVWGDYADAQALASVNTRVRGTRWTNSVTGQTACYARHWEDIFTGATTGRVLIACNEPLPSTADQVTTTFGPLAGFTSTGIVALPNLNDRVEWTMPTFIIGHTGFVNSAPTLTGTNTGNFLYEYQIDTGSGFSDWKTLNGANLSAEVVPPYVSFFNRGGFRLKIRATCTVASTTNALTYIRIETTTTTTAMAYTYPLRMPIFSWTGTEADTKAFLFDSATDEIAGKVITSTNKIELEMPWDSDYTAITRIRKGGYQPIELSPLVTPAGLTSSLEQVRWSSIPLGDPGALGITVTDHGASPVTWNTLPFSITIQTTNDSLTATEIAQFISWNIAQNQDFSSIQAFRWPTMIEPSGSGFRTLRGDVIGSTGASLKGIRVVRNDGITPVVGFTAMMSDNGTYWTAPESGTFQVSGFLANSGLFVKNVTKDTIIYNAIVAGTSWSTTYDTGTTFDAGDSFEVRVTHVAGAVAQKPVRNTGTVTSSGATVTISQQPWTEYNTLAIDGSSVTECVTDFVEIDIDVDDADNSTTKARLAAFIVYAMHNEALGRERWFDVISFRSAGSALIQSDVALVRIDNVKAGSILNIIDPFQLRMSNGSSMIQGSSNTINWDNSAEVLIVAVGSGVTAQDKVDIGAAVLAAASSTPIAANTKRVNDIPISGAGTELDPWGP
jgi:hypothetical protein